MSIENIVSLYADSHSEIIKLLQMLYPSEKNKTTEERCFLNKHINAYVHSLSPAEIQWLEEEYHVRVNHEISFRYFSTCDVNSASKLMYIMNRIICLLNCDMLYLPNGDEPTMIRRSGIIVFDSKFDRYFGEGASDSLRKTNNDVITEEISSDGISRIKPPN